MVRKVLRYRYRQLRMFSTLVRQVRLPCIKTFMKNNPTLSNALIYGGLYTAAEVSQQSIRNHRAAAVSGLGASPQVVLDRESVARFAVMGTGIMGPLFSKWYGWIDRAFPGRSKAVVLRKTILDQFAFTPVCVAVFFVGMAAMEGHQGKKLFEELREKGPKTFAMDCCFWIPTTAINFLFMPAWLRVTFVSVASFVWLNVLSWIKSQPLSVSSQASPAAASSSSSSVQPPVVNIIN